MSQPIGVGIVGYGKVASGTHQRWVTQREDVNLAAVCEWIDATFESAKTGTLISL
ncbi:MAG: hypothetical protein O7G87_06815 [bacterium]|nr:hypothetical protein [bacterium]